MSAVLVIDDRDRRWVLASPRWRDRWRGNRLDDELAAGLPPEESRARAARAAVLVAPDTRNALAGRWAEILARTTGRPSTGRSATNTSAGRSVMGGPATRRSGVPVGRSRVLAAAADIRALVEALRARAPVPARGVAIANRLLTDGAGPLYRTGSGDLGATVRSAVRHLAPDTLRGV
jgi:hypothetical protein